MFVLYFLAVILYNEKNAENKEGKIPLLTKGFGFCFAK